MSHSKSALSIASSCKTYVPNLQTVGLVCRFIRWQRNFRIPSSAAFGKIGEQYTKAIDRFAAQRKIPRLQFQKGRRKRGPRSGALGRAKDRKTLFIPGFGPADGLPQPFLFLPVGCRMGFHVLEDQRLCPLSDLVWLNGQGNLQFEGGVKGRFNPFRDSAGYTIVMRWQRRPKIRASLDSFRTDAVEWPAALVHETAIANRAIKLCAKPF
jgi:hypothetical protein